MDPVSESCCQLQLKSQLVRLVKEVPGKLIASLHSLWGNNLLQQLNSQIGVLSAKRFYKIHRIQKGRSVEIAPNVQINASDGTSIFLGDGVLLKRDALLISEEKNSRIALAQLVRVGEKTEIRAKANCIEVGQSTSIGSHCYILGIDGIRIGKGCRIGDRAILKASQPNWSVLFPSVQIMQLIRCGIVIEDNCWIGNNVSILGRVTIGEGCAISDDSVIIDDIPPFSIASGAPAKVIAGGLNDFRNGQNID